MSAGQHSLQKGIYPGRPLLSSGAGMTCRGRWFSDPTPSFPRKAPLTPAPFPGLGTSFHRTKYGFFFFQSESRGASEGPLSSGKGPPVSPCR